MEHSAPAPRAPSIAAKWVRSIAPTASNLQDATYRKDEIILNTVPRFMFTLMSQIASIIAAMVSIDH
jgi:hypothetical protein